MKNKNNSLAHGPIKNVFPNVFMVTGTNITNHDGIELQHSRNMIIYKEGDKLTLINSVRLSDAGLSALEKLGKITHIVRIGAFHGRDDAFYKNRYQAKLWALEGMHDDNNAQIDFILKPNAISPFEHCEAYPFNSSKFPEAVIHIDEHDGILITCDSVKNWAEPDEFFSKETASLYKKLGFLRKASIADVWINATQTKKTDFDDILTLPFQHLLSAHGEALIADAKAILTESVKNRFS